MSTARSRGNDDEEKKVSPADQPVPFPSSYESDFFTLLEKSEEEREQIINASANKTEVQKGLQTLKSFNLNIKENQTAVILAGTYAFVVAVALSRLKNKLNLTNQHRIAVGKAGSNAIKITIAIIELIDFNPFLKDDYQSFYLLDLDTDEFLKLVNAMMLAIREKTTDQKKMVLAFNVLMNHKTLRLTEDMIKAVCKIKPNYNVRYEDPTIIADAIIFLHEHANEMKTKVDYDTVASAGNNAVKFVKILFDLEKSNLVLSTDLIQKILTAINNNIVNNYSDQLIIDAFLERERIETLRNLMIIQHEYTLMIRSLPTSLFNIVLTYFQSGTDSMFNPVYQFSCIRSGVPYFDTTHPRYGQFESNRKLDDLTRFALEQCQKPLHFEILDKIFYNSSINNKLFMMRPNLFLDLMVILEKQYQPEILPMLLTQVPYATLIDEAIRTKIAEGFQCLFSEDQLKNDEANYQAVVTAREYALEVAISLIILKQHGALDANNRAILLKNAKDASIIARQLIENDAPANDTEHPCEQNKKKRPRVSDSSMFKSKIHAHGETSPNQSTRSRSPSPSRNE